MRNEIWKDIVGYEGHYQVSDQGRVKSLHRIVPKSDGRYHTVREIIRKPVPHTVHGYLEVIFTRGRSSQHSFKIHRLVAEAFLGHSELQVNHKNGIKTDNRLINLEYVTNLENMNHRERCLNNRKKYGVYLNKLLNKWQAQIKVENHRVYLGIYNDKEEAYDVFYLAYVISYGVAPW